MRRAQLGDQLAGRGDGRREVGLLGLHLGQTVADLDVFLGRERVAGTELAVATAQQPQPGGARRFDSRVGAIGRGPGLDGRVEGRFQRGGERLLVGRVGWRRRKAVGDQGRQAGRPESRQLDQQVLPGIVETQPGLHLRHFCRASQIVGPPQPLTVAQDIGFQGEHRLALVALADLEGT